MANFAPSMSSSDALLWNIEHDPVLRTTITAVALLDRSPEWNRLVAKLERGTLDVPRLRQRVVEPPLRLGPPEWVDDPDFDLSYHLRRVRAPQPGTLRTVLDIAEPLSMAAFDRTRPLWEFTVVEGLEGGRAALIQKLHHSVADGVGGIEVAMMLLDLEPDAPAVARPAAPTPQPRRSAPQLGARVLGRRLRGMTRTIGAVPMVLARAGRSLVREPVGALDDAAALTASIARMVAPAGTPGSTLFSRRTLGRRFHVLEVPLDALKAAAHDAGCTLNAAFLAGAVGGIARYHDKHGTALTRLRVDMPVNIRGAGDDLGGNRFVPTRFLVPAGIDDPVERMCTLGELADHWRQEPALGISDTLAGLLNALPRPVVTGVFGSMLKGVDFTATNIPGIGVPVWIAGALVEREWALAPPSGAALSFALLSHGGTACIGVVCDTGAVEDDDGLVACVVDAFDELVAAGGRTDATTVLA